MKRYKLVLLLIIPLALYAYIARRNAWRPYTLEVRGYSPSYLLFSPEGRYLLVNHYARGVGAEVLIFDRETQHVVKKIVNAEVRFFVGNDNLVVLHKTGTTVRTEVYSLREGTLLARSPDKFQAYAALADGKSLLGGTWNIASLTGSRSVVAWDFKAHPARVETGTFPTAHLKAYGALPPLLPYRQPSKIERNIQPSANLQVVFIADYIPSSTDRSRGRGLVQLWDIPSKKVLFKRQETTIGNSDQHLCATTSDGLFAYMKGINLEIWDTKTGKRRSAFTLRPTVTQHSLGMIPFWALDLSPDGTLVACAMEDGIGLWDTETGRLLRILPAQGRSVSCVVFSPDSQTLASGMSDGGVKIWRIK